MAVKFRKKAIKFLEKASPEEVAKIQKQLNKLFTAIEEQGIIPFSDFDIKKLKGEWEGFYRLRIGKVRVVLAVNFDSLDVEIYSIGSRGDIYK